MGGQERTTGSEDRGVSGFDRGFEGHAGCIGFHCEVSDRLGRRKIVGGGWGSRVGTRTSCTLFGKASANHEIMGKGTKIIRKRDDTYLRGSRSEYHATRITLDVLSR